MSERALQLPILSRPEARALTDEVKHDAEQLWRKLVRLYEGGAHRVEFNGAAPTHAELVFMLGFLFLAEDRYDGPTDRGRFWLWSFVQRLVFHGKTPEEIRKTASDAAATMEKKAAA